MPLQHCCCVEHNQYHMSMLLIVAAKSAESCMPAPSPPCVDTGCSIAAADQTTDSRPAADKLITTCSPAAGTWMRTGATTQDKLMMHPAHHQQPSQQACSVLRAQQLLRTQIIVGWQLALVMPAVAVHVTAATSTMHNLDCQSWHQSALAQCAVSTQHCLVAPDHQQ